MSEEELETGFADGYLIPVEPISSRVEYGWMAEFAETVADRRLREMLDLALDGRGAFRRFKDVLSNYPAERERWFGFHQERFDHEMQEWLAENEIEPTTPLPKKDKNARIPVALVWSAPGLVRITINFCLDISVS